MEQLGGEQLGEDNLLPATDPATRGSAESAAATGCP